VSAADAQQRPSLGLKLGVAGFVAAVAVVGYLVTGSPQSLGPQAAEPAAGGGGMSAKQIESMVGKLARKLEQNPEDATGWTMLGRSYMVLGRYAQAKTAFERRLKLQTQDAGAHADLADAMAMAGGRSLQGEPSRLVERALQLDPNHPKALALAGSAAFDRGDFLAAARHWDRVAELAGPDSEAGRQARSGADEARLRAGAAAQPATAASSVSGTVTLAPALKDRAQPDDAVFVFARSADAGGSGPKPPLAVLRARVRDLPLPFTLDDRLAMVPGAGVSSARQVIVGARVSKSGQPAPAAGDLEGLSAAVPVGTAELKIEIGRVVP
jgi:cytochrome c-type biogenesis protein CcmH